MNEPGTGTDRRQHLRKLVELTDISKDCGPLDDIPLELRPCL